MREDEFRDRLKGAIGEPPPLASPSYGPGTTARRRLYPAAMGVLAVALAVLLVLVLVGTRLALTPRGNVGPLGKDGGERPLLVAEEVRRQHLDARGRKLRFQSADRRRVARCR